MTLLEEITKDAYLVGGAVRDMLLCRPIKDRDYVVVGRTPEEMIRAGFKQVGASFPVFLHPETGEEYALARTERKTGDGYTGFEFDANPNITLEQDLFRRDLTMNAIAIRDGDIIDPFGGREDIDKGIIRHISEHFSEDPLRVYRVARFFSYDDNMVVSSTTRNLCYYLANCTDELKTISTERVGIEMMKAMKSSNPSNFFRFLKEIDALHIHFPEVDALINQTQPVKWHPEGDAFEHTMQVLDYAAYLSDDVGTRIAALCHDFGKGLTKSWELPKHIGHEYRGVPLVKNFCTRLCLGNDIMKRAMFATRWHGHVHRVYEMNPKTFVNMFEEMDRNLFATNMRTLVTVSSSDCRGRGSENLDCDIGHVEVFSKIMHDIHDVTFDPTSFEGKTTEQIKNIVRQKRLRVAKKSCESHREERVL